MRDALSGVFGRWGKCGAMRVDNGLPLGAPKKETTSPLALWLIGHDVDMIFNKPYCPQANAKVERMQDVSRRWAEADSARHLAHLQGRLDQEALVQRAGLGVSRMGYLTRLESFPNWRPAAGPGGRRTSSRLGSTVFWPARSTCGWSQKSARSSCSANDSVSASATGASGCTSIWMWAQSLGGSSTDKIWSGPSQPIISPQRGC